MDPSRKRREVWKFISFAMILSSIFMIYPILYSIYLSLHTMQGLQSVFVGLDNYVRMFQDTIFHKALFNNFVFLIFQVPIMVFLGLLLAFVLNTPKLVGRTFLSLPYFCQVSPLWFLMRFYLR